ncbi:hypothetical protein [Hyphomonas sp.]|uniref:hypothetical protein n=1 Tax=Hyphomonas sp. TaxID=87 RepID=UPI001BCC80C5
MGGMRGLAAIWGLLAHYTIGWTQEYKGQSICAYGDILSDWLRPGPPVLACGVKHFFFISGFVTAALLRNSTSLFYFTLRQLSMLWPARVVCTTLTTPAIMVSGNYLRYDSNAGWEFYAVEFL